MAKGVKELPQWSQRCGFVGEVPVVRQADGSEPVVICPNCGDVTPLDK